MAKRRSPEAAELRTTLTDSDPQVRLNAAVRLAYLGDADGVSELVAGLSHPDAPIGLVQVPEALSLLGEDGLAPARRLIDQHDGDARARLGAARALMHAGETAAIPAALPDLLAASDSVGRREAVAMAGELASGASPAFHALVGVYHDGDGSVLPALASVGGERALPLITAALDDDSADVRLVAMRALAGLGRTGAGCFPRLADIVRTTASLRERLAAVHAIVRVAPDGDAAASALRTSMDEVDCWSRIGLLRGLAQLAPGYPRRPEHSGHWPPWEARFVHSAPPLRLDAERDAVLDILLAMLDDDDHDVRRNAALAIALFARAGRTVAGRVRSAPRIDEGLRYDVLRSLRAIGPPRTAPIGAHRWRFTHLDPSGWPWDLFMTLPDLDLDAIAPSCEEQWARTSAGDSDYRIRVPKWVFLQYLVQRHGLLLHGSGTDGIDELRPVSRSWGGGRTSGQPGIFAVDHAPMAMYFGLVDRTKLRNLSNGLFRMRRPDGAYERCFVLGAEFAGLPLRPFRSATVYVLPPDTFSMMGELTSLVPVRPLGRLPIEPEEFPLLEHLWGSDVGPLSGQFGYRRFPFLYDVGCWPAKRSERSAKELLTPPLSR